MRLLLTWSSDVPAGEIDRDKLGEMVFNERLARRKLNSATHIPVALELVRQLAVQWLSLTCVAVSPDVRIQRMFFWKCSYRLPINSGSGHAFAVRDRLSQIHVAKSVCHMQSQC